MSTGTKYAAYRYFTPPKIGKLNLDLASLAGGGYAPAQFYGETHDGRHLYCRYRDGWLTITELRGSDDDLMDGRELLSVNLGPPLHGGLTVGQLCQYVGITINGVMPPLPTPEEMAREGAKDLSGQTSFFDVTVKSTHKTQRSFLEALMRGWGQITIIEPVSSENFRHTGWRLCSSIDAIAKDGFCIIRGVAVSDEELQRVRVDVNLQESFPEALIVSVFASGFRFPLRTGGNSLVERAQQICGRELHVAGQSDDMLYGSFSLHAQFGTDDAEALRQVQHIHQLFDEIYPRFRVEEVNLVTRQRTDARDYTISMDPEIASWVSANDDRWYFVVPQGTRENPVAVGLKLSPVAPH